MNEQIDIVFIFGDGDRVRERIEAFLFDNQLEALSSLSNSLKAAIELLARLFIQDMAADIVMAAGDDLLVRVPADKYSRPALEKLAEIYKTRTDTPISFGVGPTVERAYLNLRRAKVSAREKIVETGAMQ